jgi:transcription elongation factor Elf1
VKTPLDNLKPLIHCPACNKEYRPAKILLLDQEEKRSTLHLTCDSCGASTLVYVSLSQYGVVSMGVLTDLDQSEAKGLFKEEPVSPDEVLEVHEFLKQHEGGVDDFIR